MKLFSSPLFSLFCTGFNVFFAIGSFMHGNLALGVICALFATVCFRNFLTSTKEGV